jgi:hypothetical protein
MKRVATGAGEPIPFDPNQLRLFANTFLLKVSSGGGIAANVLGKNPHHKNNDSCSGWVNLAAADPQVYDRCLAAALRVDDGEQRYLNILSHAALLSNKRWLPN